MRNILILLTLLISMCLLGGTVFAETITTKDYFVLSDGTMTFTGGNQVVTTESAPSQCNLISEPVFGVNYPGYPHRFFNYDSEGNLMFYGAYFGSEYIYIPPSGGVQWLPSELEIGSTYTSTWNRDEYAYSGCGYSGAGSDSLSIAVTGPETVTVPAGTFETYRLVYVDDWKTSTGSSGTATFTYWLAKDVGWVKMILGGVTYELMSHEGPPPPPQLSVTTSGTTVSLSWSAKVSADGYTLFYAPYPYTGPDSIGSVDMGTQTGGSFDLWEGAAFYVAIQAYNNAGSSGYSNIESFSIGMNASLIHVENFSDWAEWKSNDSLSSNYLLSGDTVMYSGDGCEGDLWHQLSKTFEDSIGISGVLNISSILGCAQIGFRQMFSAQNDATYHYHFNIDSCGSKKINIFVQKVDANGEQLSRKDINFDHNVLNEDLRLSLKVNDAKIWFFLNDGLLKTMDIPSDVLQESKRRDLKVWIDGSCSSSINAVWKSIDVVYDEVEQ